MHTPSGRFEPSARLCLSISDFHPKSFNPAWEVSTILIGLLSFMTSEEITAGSIRASDGERKIHAAKSRWWNSTGGGTHTKSVPGVTKTTKGIGNIKVGDGGLKFRTEWPELDAENWKWMTDRNINQDTGLMTLNNANDVGTHSLRRRAPGSPGEVDVAEEAHSEPEISRANWHFKRKTLLLVVAAILGYSLIKRVFDETT